VPYHSQPCPNTQPSSFHITRPSIWTRPFVNLWEWEKHTGDIEAEENPPAVQAHPLVSIISDKTPKSQKKVSSLIQKSYVCISCNPPSCSSNQSGPTSYTPCHDFEVVNVYMTQALGGLHPSKQPHIPWAE